MMTKIYDEDDDYSDSDEESTSEDEDSSSLESMTKKRSWTLREVKREFLRDFKPVSWESQAQTKIETIRMEGALADIDKYNSQFKLYAKDTGYNDKALMKHYQKGLPKGLVDQISLLSSQPKNLVTLQKVAVKQHMIWAERQAEKALWNKQRGEGGQQTKGSQDMGDNQIRIMEVNAFQSNTPGASSNTKYPLKLTNEERERMRKEGRCFGCRKKGHTTRNCPTFPRSTTTNTNNTALRPSIRATTATTESLSFGTNTTMKDISELTTKIRSLSGEEKEQAAGYLKELITQMDF
ncbi:hypothetical protein D9758_001047 [Tetrapyrgos nigripes]|uniref:CCHC-type domain-containing protein n=1 Tax=Tetrapyrgos nigripes TaxID=182062 RepID=A0A8H5GSP0_9AGAR|nr:hypothetical protein D9758_001047 [Tetrapyrgos nigripes]